MILIIKKLVFIYIISKFNSKKNLSYLDLNFRKIDFTNHDKIKAFIFKKNFYTYKNKNIHSFDFLNFSNNSSICCSVMINGGQNAITSPIARQINPFF